MEGIRLPGNPGAAPLYQEVNRAAWLGLGVNLSLGVMKIIAGSVAHSYALLSDAVNSLGDVVTTVVVLIALRLAQQPPDDEHPYGHTRAEAIAASNVALLIIISALALAWRTLDRPVGQAVIPPGWALVLAAVNVIIKEALYRYKLRVGTRTGSAAIIANAWDHRSDALCSFAVLVGLFLTRIGGQYGIWADTAASLLVIAVVVANGIVVFRRSVHELLDPQAGDDFVREIRGAAITMPGVLGVEKLWVRKSGLEFFADIHLEVDPEITVAEGHRIGHAVRDRLIEKFPPLRDVLVHLEPYASTKTVP